jgi:polyisoprenoid-binding protein YceI
MIRPLLLLLTLLSPNAPAQAGERYKIDPEHTYSSFEYKHWGLSLQRGRFDKNIGFLELDIPEKTGAINIEIDANSVSTGNDLFNTIMRSDSFFDALQYPKIIFNSTKFLFDEEKLVQIEGLLTIKETTRPVTVEVTQFGCRFMLLYLKQACGANGQTKILRSDYKVGRYVPFVSDEITLYFSVEAIKE